MSKMTYVEAIEYVLDTELDARDDLICLRPGARRALAESERDVSLPRIGKKAFFAALGAAMYGTHPVLDLRQESGAAQLLREAMDDLSFGMSPVMTIIICAEDKELMMELPGAYVMRPETPRQAAGFLRSALKMNRLSVVIADQALFAEEDDIPEDRSFALLPLEPKEEADEAAEEETEAPGAEENEPMDEETAYNEAEAQPVHAAVPDEEEAYEEAEKEPVRVIFPAADDPKDEAETGRQEDSAQKPSLFCAVRQTKCDLTALNALCELLDMDREKLVERCAGHVLPLHGGFELHYEPDVSEGEAAFLPPVEEDASVWLGGGMLTISYDPAKMKHDHAAELLRAVKRVIEKPQLLIYDKEYDRQ